MTSTPLKPGQKRIYIARVKDVEGDHTKYGGDFFRVKTHSNPEGNFSTRKAAQDALDRAKANYHDGKLTGFVDTAGVGIPVTLETIDINEWLTGDVKPISSVPKALRAQYEDTLRRGALAAQRYGHPITVNESFRTREQQEHFYALYLAGGNLAAKPGTSPHEKGIGLDIPNAREIPKLIKELRALQLIDDVPSEKWHVTNHHRV